MRRLLIILLALLLAVPTFGQRVAIHGLGGGHKIGIGGSSGIGDTTPPVTVITVPVAGATVSASTTITATDTDNVGVVTLQLYIDGLLYSTQTSPPSPTTFSWNTVAYSNGTHSLMTTATDGAGNIGSSTLVNVTVSNLGPAPTFSTLPQIWAKNGASLIPGGSYDTDITLGTTVNNGPNNLGGVTLGSAAYPKTLAGLKDAAANWRDNANNTFPAPAPYFADKAWRIQVPAGLIIHGTTFDSNPAQWTLPGKLNPIGNVEPTKGLVIQSTSPLTAGQMVCSHGLAAEGGTRNPGCDGHIAGSNDKASMWRFQMDNTGTVPGQNGIYAGTDTVNPLGITGSCRGFNPCIPYANHISIFDIAMSVAPGASQSGASVKAPVLFRSDNGQGSTTGPAGLKPWATNIHLDRAYVSGNDPGDPGQPVAGSALLDAAGNCKVWDNSGTVTTIDQGNGTSKVVWASGAFFGLTYTNGSTITIAGTPYVIADASQVQSGGTNSFFYITGSINNATAVAYTEVNPPAQYTPGCGDDLEKGIILHCDFCSLENSYVEKIHWFGNESQAVLYGFSNGPVKIVNNWIEGGSEGLFSGGGPVDANGGPASNIEIRRNHIGKDLNWRQLSATSGKSVPPPFGCATTDGTAGDNTCPYNWAMKNDLELKLGHNVLVDGNEIEDSWPDGQSGYCVLINVRVCSGGSVCGIFDPVTGLPKTYIDNIHFSNNWIRNCAQPLQMSNRSEKPTDGGGNSLPVQNNDFINNLLTNVSDAAQFGNPAGTGSNDWQWTDGTNPYICAITGTGALATANCIPYQSDISAKITKISSAPTTSQLVPPTTATADSGAITNLANGFDGDTSTFASAIDSNTTATPAQMSFFGFPAIPGTAVPVSLVLIAGGSQGGGSAAIWTGTYTLTGGSATTPFPGFPTTGTFAQTTFTVPLSSSQDLTKIKVTGSVVWGGANGIDNLRFYEVYVVMSNGTQVTVVVGVRTDPMLCSPGNSAACVASGQTFILGGVAGWNGTFAMNNSSGNWNSDGTGGSNVIYTDTTNNPGTATLCDNKGSPTCTSLFVTSGSTGTATLASLGFKLTDISVGDNVYAKDSGDGTCTSHNYLTNTILGAPAVLAVTGTVPTGLVIKYPSTGTGAATCIINNGAGFPKNTTFQNNTILAVNKAALVAFNLWWQPINNWFFSNVFADNDSGKQSDVYCQSQSQGEGSASFPCWDNATLQYYHNVMTGRASANWSTINCPVSGAACLNSFPIAGGPGGSNGGVNCSGATATVNCMGYSGFMGPTPAVTYPTGNCTSAPFNCPLMALPWANNLSLSNLSYVGSSSYSTQGVNVTTLGTAMTQTTYVCATSCGAGPNPD